MAKLNKKYDKKRNMKKNDEIAEQKQIKAELRAKKRSEPGEVKGFMRAVPAILVATALFVSLCFITGETGAFGSFISKFLKGLFSYMAYAVPLLITVHAIYFYKDIREHKLLSRAIVSVLTLITLSSAAYIISAFSSEIVFAASEFYSSGIANRGGGFIGGLFGFLLAKIFGKFGLIIIIALALILIVFYYLQGSGGISRFFLERAAAVANFGAKIERRALEKKKAKSDARLKKQRESDDKKHREIYNDDFFHADNGLSTLEIPELGILETKNGLSDTHILRETVIRKDAEAASNFSGDEPKVNSDYKAAYGEPSFVRADTPQSSSAKVFRSDDIIYEEKASVKNDDDFFERAESSHPRSDVARSFGVDENATSVFTADFDPFDLAVNEARASKQSSRAAELKKEPAGYSEFISEMSPEQTEHLRRLEAFEESRKEAIRRKEEAVRADAEMRAKVAAENERIAKEKEDMRKAEEAYRLELQRKEEERRAEEQTRSTSCEVGTVFEFGKKEPSSPITNDDTADSSKKSNDDAFSFEDKEEVADSFASWEKFEPQSEILRPEHKTIEISRTMLDSTLDDEPCQAEVNVNTDFTFDEDEEAMISDEAYIPEDEEEFSVREEIPEEEQNPKINEYRSMFTVFDEDEKASDASYDIADDASDSPDLADEEAYPDEDEDFILDKEDTAPFDSPAVISQTVSSPAPSAEKKKSSPPDYSNYRFPPIELLKRAPAEDTSSVQDEMQIASEQLLNTLESFNIRATLKGMERGPRVTRYSIVPAKGIRVSQIEKLSDDIALAMAAESIRIEAPIPGKSAVGIEVPNKVPTIVSLRELIEADEFVNNKSKTAVCLGKSVEGTNVFGDIGKMPHLLVAGATGMGKSVCMNTLITSILYKARPDEVKFIMIDPKKVEFSLYKELPHLLVPVVTEPKAAAGSLLWAVDEMNRRYEVIEKLSIRNIDTYNQMVAENPELGAPLPKIVIFIDELNDLMMQARDPVENLIMLIAQKARAAGIHLVIGTQRPSVNVITGVIKANINSRIACKVSSGIDSRTILEQTGAEKLIGKGDMLFSTTDRPKPIRVQGAFVSDFESSEIVNFVKKQAKGELYDEQAMEDMKRAAQKCDKKNGEDDFDDDDDNGGVGYLHDRKFLNAVELAIRNGSVATSFLQRKLHIGYGKAAQYIDIMEDLGIVGEKNGSKARDILISMSEWNEKLSRLTCD